jgi:hypothetical protein
MNHGLSQSVQNKFNSTKGMSTKVFGPKLWDSLFTMVLGSYPPIFNPKLSSHIRIKNAIVNTLKGLKYTLPCSFCRASYRIFYKELPIKNFLDTRVNLMYWIYLMKDKVNKKLIKQELEYINNIHLEYKKNKISNEEYKDKTQKCFVTAPSPDFITVLQRYEQNRAICNKKLQKCVSKK